MNPIISIKELDEFSRLYNKEIQVMMKPKHLRGTNESGYLITTNTRL